MKNVNEAVSKLSFEIPGKSSVKPLKDSYHETESEVFHTIHSNEDEHIEYIG